MNAGAAEGANRRFATVAANRVSLKNACSEVDRLFYFKNLTFLFSDNIITVNLMAIILISIIRG